MLARHRRRRRWRADVRPPARARLPKRVRLPMPAPACPAALKEETAAVDEELAEAEAKNRLYELLAERTRQGWVFQG